METAEFELPNEPSEEENPKVDKKWHIFKKEVQTSFSFYFLFASLMKSRWKWKQKRKQKVNEK